MGEFDANISATQKGIGKLTQSLATFNLASDVIEKISDAFNGIIEAGASAELQYDRLIFSFDTIKIQAIYI